jgi:hypothetical protein
MATVPYGSWGEAERRVGGRRRWLKLAAVAVVGAAVAWWLIPGQPVAESGISGAITAASADDLTGESLQGVDALRRCRELLVAAQKKLDAVPTMSAVFQKQERIEDELKPLNVMDLKVRREPLGIYMKWQQPDAGQELIWRQGAFDGKIVVCPAGWRRKVMPMVKVDPTGDMAMAVSRRPITNIGIWNFTKRLNETVTSDAVLNPAQKITMTAGDQVGGNPVYRFTFENPQPGPQANFQKMVIFVDRKLEVPVAFELYGWVEGDATKGRLEESYLFRDLKLDVGLTETDFDHQNPAYAFTAK